MQSGTQVGHAGRALKCIMSKPQDAKETVSRLEAKGWTAVEAKGGDAWPLGKAVDKAKNLKEEREMYLAMMPSMQAAVKAAVKKGWGGPRDRAVGPVAASGDAWSHARVSQIDQASEKE